MLMLVLGRLFSGLRSLTGPRSGWRADGPTRCQEGWQANPDAAFVIHYPIPNMPPDYNPAGEGGERKLTPTRSVSPADTNLLPARAYATTSFTSMLPRVALEYGQTM